MQILIAFFPELLLALLTLQRYAGPDEGEDEPEHLALDLGGSVVGRGEEVEAVEERVKGCVEGGVVVDAARVASGGEERSLVVMSLEA
jgi:hypothetical protein